MYGFTIVPLKTPLMPWCSVITFAPRALSAAGVAYVCPPYPTCTYRCAYCRFSSSGCDGVKMRSKRNTPLSPLVLAAVLDAALAAIVRRPEKIVATTASFPSPSPSPVLSPRADWAVPPVVMFAPYRLEVAFVAFAPAHVLGRYG